MIRPHTSSLEARPVELALEPLEVVRAWPEGMPVAAMVSGASGAGERSRWSIIARPGEWEEVDGLGAIVPRNRGRTKAPDSSASGAEEGPAFVGGWVGFLSYELGTVLEPSAGGNAEANRQRTPLGGWARCDSAYVHDNVTGRWWVVGDADELPDVEGLRERAGRAASGESSAGFAFDGPLRSVMGRAAYERAVARAVEYIRAGDVFQVNLAHTLTGRTRGSPRRLFAALAQSAGPWYGSLLETPWGVIASVSPELFLDYDAQSRRAVTRPMKGTRGGERSAAELMASEKDAAELNMIVDLMRNDLGRVCEFGSVRVETPREVEAHGGVNSAARRGGGVLQGVATVSGVVRAEAGLEGLMRAAFPPGSITGAPKVRAMQIINELEGGVARGPYCGCIGFVSDSGRAEFSVAIRTAVLTRDRVPGSGARVPCLNGDHHGERGEPKCERSRAATQHSSKAMHVDAGDELWEVRYGVGAGIVADSDPESEWRETLVKARVWNGIAPVLED